MKLFKIVQLILVFSALLIMKNSNAQGFNITNLSPSGYGTVFPCDTNISLQFSAIMPLGVNNATASFLISGTNFSTTPLVVAVSWGDGTSSTHQGTASTVGQAISFNPPVMHSYLSNPLAVSYPIFVSVANPLNNTYAFDSLIHTIQPCGGASTNLYGILNIDCDSNGVIDTTLSNFPIIVSGQGISTTLQFTNGQTQVNNLLNGTYTWEVDPSFLSMNGYFVNYQLPQTLTIGAGPTTILAELFCNSSSYSSGCVGIEIFCDSNGNGIWDMNEAEINNAPITITNLTNGISQTTYSMYGMAFLQFFNGVSTDSISVSVDASWLSMNGYYFPNNSQITSYPTCNTGGDTVIFAINCDSAVQNDECIKGYLFCDANNNGTMDIGEEGISNAPVQIGTWNNPIFVYTDSNGFYIYNSSNTVGPATLVSISNYWLQQNGYTSLYDSMQVLTNCDSNYFSNFAINCGSGLPCADAWSEVTPWIGYYQNSINYVKLKWGNWGTSALQSYVLTLTYPVGVTPITASFLNSNYTILGNTISWTISGSNSSYFNNYDVIQFSVPGGLSNGTAHVFSSTISETGTNEDCYFANNNGSLTMILGNSYDPNDKTVHQPALLDPSATDELTYTIRFQNTGTAPAQDIYVLDTLDTNLDWSTLKIKNMSHYMQLIDLGNGVMKFNFPGIWLPDSTSNEPLSHGEFTYTIQENQGNGNGTAITNTAHIYFDWNPAIVTNTTFNINSALELQNTQLNVISVFPNPTNDFLALRSAKSMDAIQITDMTGKMVKTLNVSGESSNVDLSEIATGIYLVNVITNNEISTIRIVKK